MMAARRAKGVGTVRFIPIKREKELWLKAVELAIETRNADALIKILIAAGQFHYGKPFEAINPAMAGKPKAQDGTLLMAIRNLQIVSQSPGQITDTQAIDSKAIRELPSECQLSSSDSDNQAPVAASDPGDESEADAR